MSQRNKKKSSGPLLVILILVCVCVMGFSAYKLISIRMNYSRAQSEYEDLRRYTEPQSKEEDPSPDEPEETDSESEPVKEEAEERSSKDKSTPAEKPLKAPISVDHESLEALNPHYLGWLFIEALDISYPVMQGPDDDYYLHRTFEGNNRYAGSLFINSDASKDLSDPHSIIYGHNMKDASMFGTLNLLTSHGLYSESDLFWILTKEKDYCYRIFSIHTCLDTSSTYTLFSGPSGFVKEYIDEMIRLSDVVPSEISYDDNSKIVTLSTCVDAEGPERYVVQGILIN